jgi:hypothetical protein
MKAFLEQLLIIQKSKSLDVFIISGLDHMHLTN